MVRRQGFYDGDMDQPFGDLSSETVVNALPNDHRQHFHGIYFIGHQVKEGDQRTCLEGTIAQSQSLSTEYISQCPGFPAMTGNKEDFISQERSFFSRT